MIPMHGDGAVPGEPGTYVGNTLYTISPDHAPALVAIALLGGIVVLGGIVGLAGRFRHRPEVARVLAGYQALPLERRVVLWSLAISTAAHAGLVIGHGWTLWSALFAVDTALLGRATWAVLTDARRSWMWAGTALTGNVLGLVVTGLAKQTPDQVAMAVTLRQALGVTAVCCLAVLVAVGAWVAGLAGGIGHHVGTVPPLGALVPAGAPRDPTVAEQAAADALYQQAVTALARYRDPAVAIRDGYQVSGVHGLSFHADNPRYRDDGRILDPARPETLVYAESPRGPVLLGAMFQMPGLDDVGPAVGGPLTVWHAHEQVCFGGLPPGLAGLTSPFGVCPPLSITVSRTNEMIHVWTVPGAPQRFGDLPESWIHGYVTRLASSDAAATS
jgi:hypothetical protein